MLPLQNNTSVNSTAFENVGFDTEEVIVRHGEKMKRVLLTYDLFASHTTMNYAVKEDLQLDTKYIGSLSINTYSGLIEEKGYQVSATIDGLNGKIDFIICSCSQNIPLYEYEVPSAWKTICLRHQAVV